MKKKIIWLFYLLFAICFTFTAINIILQWRLQVLDYFIIDYVNNSMKLKYGY